MRDRTICVLILLAVGLKTTAAFESYGDFAKFVHNRNDARSDPPVHIACMAEHCASPAIGCIFDNKCRKAVECSQGCWENWDKDKSKEKFAVQNCTNECSFSYDDVKFEDFMACVTDHECLSFPPIPNTCRGPTGVHPVKQLSVKDLQGDWWAVKGYHPVYDCYPCQRLHFAPFNDTSWNYTTEYDVYLVNGNRLRVQLSNVVMPAAPPGKGFSFIYYDVGLKHYETWWLIDKANDGSYIATYYCGNTLQWYYEGSLVLARDRTLSDGAYKNITTAYQQAVGLNLMNFCDAPTSADDCKF